jgi:hypothetical protein
MADQLFASLASIATAIIGVAILAVLVSKNANTSAVISSAGSAFGNDLGVAISPVTGASLGGLNVSNLGSNNNFSL